VTDPGDKTGTVLHGEPHPPVVHEKLDINPWSVTKVALLLAGMTAAAAVVTAGYLGLLSSFARRSDPTPPPLVRRDPNRLPPEPRLQSRPAGDLATLREEQQRHLESYGWVDEKAGVVHIPVDEAMKLFVERTAAGAPNPQDTGVPGAEQKPSPAHSPKPSPAKSSSPSATPAPTPSPTPTPPGAPTPQGISR
jgi:hypothetical protein